MAAAGCVFALLGKRTTGGLTRILAPQIGSLALLTRLCGRWWPSSCP